MILEYVRKSDIINLIGHTMVNRKGVKFIIVHEPYAITLKMEEETRKGEGHEN